MRNKKAWLIIKAVLIVLLTVVIITMPTQDNSRKWFRFAMLVVFVVSFIIDLNNYRKKNS
jgi:nicotinamide riboside transporter PnuC